MLYRHMNTMIEVSDAGPAQVVILRDFEDDSIPFERLLCPDLRYFGQAWLDFRRVAGEALPRWEEFRLRDHIGMIERFCVLRVEDRRIDDIEFSVYGAHPTEFIGDGRQISMRQLRSDPQRINNYTDIRDRAKRALEKQSPQYVRKSLSWNGKGFIEYELLMLPFQANGNLQRLLQPISARICTDGLNDMT